MVQGVGIPVRHEAPWLDTAASQAAERKSHYYSLLYQEMAERKRAEEHLRQSNALLTALGAAQLRFVSGTSLTTVLQDLLVSLLAITQSEGGIIGEQVESASYPAMCEIHAFVGTRSYMLGSDPTGIALVDRVLTTGRPASDPPLVAGIADGQPRLIALPISTDDTVVGVLALAECAGSFAPDIMAFLQPALSTCAQLILANRNEQRRKTAELALAEERSLLAQRVAERTLELRLANAELTHAVHAKDEFLATMNHELRTPLNSILLFAEILHKQLNGTLNERQLRAVSGIEESGNHLLTLINDILDVAKMDAGKLTVELAPCTIETVCQASLRLVTAMANKKQLNVTLSIDPSLGVIQADERRLKQMLVNLLSNAAKFTLEGGSFGLEVTGNEGDQTVTFSVWDTGIGIAREDLGHLFQPFVQLDSGHTRQYGGSGLGLVLVHRMAELHGGTITVESEVGRGSRFTLSLPWRRPPTEGEASGGGEPAPDADVVAWPEATVYEPVCESAEHLALDDGADEVVATGIVIEPEGASGGPLILLAEDNDANIAALTDYLRAMQYRLLVVKNGREAVEQAKRQRPDLILMDVQMPEMDGLEATQHIRNQPETAHIPIVAMTAQVMPGDRERCLEAGVNDFVGKPIVLSRLAEVLVLRLRGGDGSPK